MLLMLLIPIHTIITMLHMTTGLIAKSLITMILVGLVQHYVSITVHVHIASIVDIIHGLTINIIAQRGLNDSRVVSTV